MKLFGDPAPFGRRLLAEPVRRFGDIRRGHRFGTVERSSDGVAADDPKRSEFRFSATHRAIPGSKPCPDSKNDVAEQTSKHSLIAQDRVVRKGYAALNCGSEN